MVTDFNIRKNNLINYWVREGILTNKKIISAFRKIKREDFVLPQFRYLAYEDEPLPTMAGQTISQPTTVAIMTQQLEPKSGQKILEVGAGSGYQAAILAEIVGPKGKVVTIERIRNLHTLAKRNLSNYKNIKVIFGNALTISKNQRTEEKRKRFSRPRKISQDFSLELRSNFLGQEKSKAFFSGFAPFDRIIVTAAAEKIPEILFEQLKENGIILIPIGSKFEQRLLKIKKIKNEKQITDLGPFVFVPLVHGIMQD